MKCFEKVVKTHFKKRRSRTHSIQQSSQAVWLRGDRNPHFQIPQKLFSNFSRFTVEGILSNSIAVWWGNYAIWDRETLQRAIKNVQHICGAAPHGYITYMYDNRATKNARNIIRDGTDPQPALLKLLSYARGEDQHSQK